MSVSFNLCLFLYLQDDLEYHRIPVSREVIVEYNQTITNSVGSVSLELALPQINLIHHHHF
jgi:hypothetical protein